MTWVRLSDQTAGVEALNEAGWDAQLLWYMTLTVCAAVGEGAGNDGLLTPFMLRTTAALPAKPIPYRRAAPKLVAAGKWHDATTVRSCVACMDHGGARCTDGAYFIHEWWEHLLSSAGKHDPIARDHERRGKRLDRHPELRALIRKRDRDRCRYCGIVTRWDGDKKSKLAGTYDHVDPFGGNSLANVVVACRRCNGVKKDRTPEEAGMVLLPEPAPYLATITPDQHTNQATDQTRGPDSGLDNQPPDLDPRLDDLALARETGPGQIGAGSDLDRCLDSGQIGARSERAAPGSHDPDTDTDAAPGSPVAVLDPEPVP
jgi:5-methylcytosine-specific restriction endonuclease McrA